MSNELIELLKKMCTFVDVDYNSIDFTQHGWWELYEWTEEQELEFAEWLGDQFTNNSKIRKSILNITYKPSKQFVAKNVNYFIMMWGWKTKKQ